MLVRLILGVPPLHNETVDGVAVMTGVGFTVTVAVVEAVQLLALPVIV